MVLGQERLYRGVVEACFVGMLFGGVDVAIGGSWRHVDWDVRPVQEHLSE